MVERCFTDDSQITRLHTLHQLSFGRGQHIGVNPNVVLIYCQLSALTHVCSLDSMEAPQTRPLVQGQLVGPSAQHSPVSIPSLAMEGCEKCSWIRDAEQMATSSRDLARSRHEHDLALLESLSASWWSRSGLGWSSSGSCGWSGLGRRTRASFCQSHPDHRSQYKHAACSTPLCCAVHAPLQATARCFIRACIRNLFSCDDT